MFPRPLLAAIACVLLPAAALAVNPVTWSLDQTFSSSNTTWTSPTAVDIGLANYVYDYEITKADAIVFGISVDVLGELGDLTMDDGMGQLPAVLIDQTVLYDSALGNVSLDLFVEIASDGFARAEISNLDLPFGVSGVDLAATINMTGYEYGDYNLDGRINSRDYRVWRQAYGQSGDGNLADGNFDGRVDAADYAVWRNNSYGNALVASSPIPEPSTLWLVLSGLMGFRRRQALS